MMDRSRSVSESESQYHQIYPFKKGYIQSNSSSRANPVSNSVSLTALSQSVDPKKSKDSSKKSLNKVLSNYKFIGKVVTFKTEEAYGFIRSEQVTGDIFFSLHHLESKKEHEEVDVENLVGMWVNFTVKDVGKKSMEARKVSFVKNNTSVSYLKGRVMSWVKTGCLVQVTSGLGLKNLNNRIFVPSIEIKDIEHGVTGIEVSMKIHVDRNFKKA